MTAYYNEHDPYAAQWLRNLIEAGHIAAGVVDERDIREVTPEELVRFTQCHFFAGIGIWSLALRRNGWPDDRPIWTGSCPCQPFSGAGAREGFADERHLWPHWHWLIQHCRPDVVVGEQVAGADGLGWFDLVSDDLDGVGYASGAVNICAAGFGVDWRGSAESQRLERALRLCPDSMVSRHLGAFADWADQALAIGGFHIRQRIYFVGVVDHQQPGLEGQRDRGPAAASDAGRRGEGTGRPATEAGAVGRLSDTGRAGGAPRDPGVVGPQGGEENERGPSGLNARVRDLSDERIHDATGARRDASGRGIEGEVETDRSERRGLSGMGRDDERLSDPDGGNTGAERERRGRKHGLGTQDGGNARPGHRGVGGRDDTGPDPGEGDRPRGTIDWLLCRDGIWRPARPGTLPLVNAATARVGRLRAYGNGLDSETATRFVGAVKSILDGVA